MKAINNILEKDVNDTELIHSFQDACSNKEFYQFIKTLPIEEEILMKYTSSLEDALIEHKNCKNDACPTHGHSARFFRHRGKIIL